MKNLFRIEWENKLCVKDKKHCVQKIKHRVLEIQTHSVYS